MYSPSLESRLTLEAGIHKQAQLPILPDVRLGVEICAIAEQHTALIHLHVIQRLHP